MPSRPEVSAADPAEASTDDMVNHANEPGKRERDERPSSFLKFPPEVRNMIYHDLFECHWNAREGSHLREQPAITRVNRQLRAEALPPYYADTIFLLVETLESDDWVPFIQRIVDDFVGSPGGLPSPSSLRLLHAIEISFMTQEGVYIEAELVKDPKRLTVPDPYDHYERIMVGEPGLDWTDAPAVRAACDEAATLLEDNLLGRLVPQAGEGELMPTSGIHDQRAALDAMCIFASACPQMTSVRICDSSRIEELEPEPPDDMSYFEILAQILAEEGE